MVLTHLILNGMIKVKGQLGEMAKCLEDEDKRISDLAKLFFTELNGKENALYNNLQDVISHLSIGKHAVDEDTFERTMRFIFTFIEKVSRIDSAVAERQADHISGQASGESCRKTVPAFQTGHRRTTVERYLLLSFITAIQIRTVGEKVDRRVSPTHACLNCGFNDQIQTTILPRQAA